MVHWTEKDLEMTGLYSKLKWKSINMLFSLVSKRIIEIQMCVNFFLRIISIYSIEYIKFLIEY